MSGLCFTSHEESETDRLGEMLAEALEPGCVVGLVGTLGAGKTRFVQAVAAALGVPREEITSPTFVLISEHSGGRIPVYHCDTYRIRDTDELQELGLEEYFAAGGITFVEWADRFEDQLPAERLMVEIESLGRTKRRFNFTAMGTKHCEVMGNLRIELS